MTTAQVPSPASSAAQVLEFTTDLVVSSRDMWQRTVWWRWICNIRRAMICRRGSREPISTYCSKRGWFASIPCAVFHAMPQHGALVSCSTRGVAVAPVMFMRTLKKAAVCGFGGRAIIFRSSTRRDICSSPVASESRQSCRWSKPRTGRAATGHCSTWAANGQQWHSKGSCPASMANGSRCGRDEENGTFFDLAAALKEPAGRHLVYCCGPEPLAGRGRRAQRTLARRQSAHRALRGKGSCRGRRRPTRWTPSRWCVSAPGWPLMCPKMCRSWRRWRMRTYRSCRPASKGSVVPARRPFWRAS